MDYLNVPPELLDRPIEPWSPKVGDRVRVRVSPECGWVSPVSYWDPDSDQEVSLGEGRFGHAVSEENGRVGTIERRLSTWDYAPPHHSWLVRWDEIHPDLGWFCTPLATWEMEPLDALTDAPARDATTDPRSREASHASAFTRDHVGGEEMAPLTGGYAQLGTPSEWTCESTPETAKARGIAPHEPSEERTDWSSQHQSITSGKAIR